MSGQAGRKRRPLRFWLSVLFPERCAACGEVVQYAAGFCERCQRDLPVIRPPLCSICGQSKADCACDKHRRYTDRCVAPFCYEGAVKAGILRMKVQRRDYVMETYAAEMAHVVRREYAPERFACVTAVPMSREDRRRRGYNQAECLARALAAELGKPYRPLLAKLYETRPQKELKALERSGNLLGVFDKAPGAVIPAGSVLLVDDIATTGATLNECAKMLKIYGADEVMAVVAAIPRLSK